MDGADFARKFRLIQSAAERAGRKLVDKEIACELFLANGQGDEQSFNVAKVRWSQCKHGWRPFDDDKLTILFHALGRKVPGLLENITSEVFHQPFDALCQRLVAAGIIRPRDITSDRPLCEVLNRINDTHAVIDLLRRHDHTIAWSQQFKEAFDLLPEDQERLLFLFYKTVRECTSVRGRVRIVSLAAGTLTYVWDAFEGHSEIPKMSADLEAAIDHLKPQMVLMAEPLSYIATLHGRHGAFKRNIERLITDPHWRRTDFKERLHYCAVVAGKPAPNALARRVAVGRNIAQHLQSQRHLSEILCHDVGRVIEVYPVLARYRRHRHLAEQIKETTLQRLATADISRALRARAEDLIEGRAAS